MIRNLNPTRKSINIDTPFFIKIFHTKTLGTPKKSEHLRNISYCNILFYGILSAWLGFIPRWPHKWTHTDTYVLSMSHRSQLISYLPQSIQCSVQGLFTQFHCYILRLWCFPDLWRRWLDLKKWDKVYSALNESV